MKTNYIEQAIRKAQDGGYFWDPKMDCPAACYNSIFIDPDFWQGLGRELGWRQGETGILDQGVVLPMIEVWKGKWLDFILHLAEGKDAESFFKEILTQ